MNRLTSLLGIKYPIIQGPFGGFASQKLSAAVSEAGGLGSIGAHSLEPSAITDVIGEMRSLTSKPFAINLWVLMADEGITSSGEADFGRSLAPLARHIQAFGGELPSYKPFTPMRIEDQVRALIDAKVPVFSFIYGIPPRELLDECRKQGIKLVGTATTPDEALALEGAGVDAVVASGFEAGGHRGSFLGRAEESLTGTFSLTPQVADLLKVPVVAAGGIGDARGVAAAMALGADGVQVGTAFLACRDSGASDAHRQILLSGRPVSTGLTKGFTGRLARGVRNPLMDELNRPGVETLPYPLQRHLVRNLSALAEQAGRTDLLPLWSGQSAGLSKYKDASELLESLASGLPQ